MKHWRMGNRRTARGLMVLLLVLALLLVSVPAYAAPEFAPQHLPPECMPWYSGGNSHHQLSTWTIQAVQSGKFRAWKAGSTVVIAFQVAACGGAWMFAKFHGPNFVTNFFPTKGLGYVVAEVRGWTACSFKLVRAAVYAAAGSVSNVMSFMITPILIPKDVLNMFDLRLPVKA